MNNVYGGAVRIFLFVKQKTAYEMRISDWSSDVCSSDLTLPAHTQGPINRATLALFAGASNDYVPLHIDSDFAKAAGMDDVFGHGMLSMAYLAQLITHWVPQERLLSWTVRFTAITPLYATVTATGEEIGRAHV